MKTFIRIIIDAIAFLFICVSAKSLYNSFCGELTLFKVLENILIVALCLFFFVILCYTFKPKEEKQGKGKMVVEKTKLTIEDKRLFSSMLFAFTLPLVVCMFIIQSAPGLWNIRILSDDMYQIIAENLDLFETLRLILIVVFSFSVGLSSFYSEDNQNKYRDDNSTRPPTINPDHLF